MQFDLAELTDSQLLDFGREVRAECNNRMPNQKHHGEGWDYFWSDYQCVSQWDGATLHMEVPDGRMGTIQISMRCPLHYSERRVKVLWKRLRAFVGANDIAPEKRW